jgi:predicted metal-dependent phosphoesterase TrpH
MFKIDLHVHTNPLSPDSFMSAEQAIETAKEIGLDGICFTEHDRAWQLSEIQLLREKHGFPVFRGVEVMLHGGIEMLVFGLNIDFTSLLQISDLRKMVTAAKGFMVYAHPCRGLPELTVSDSAAALEITLGKADIASIDAVEGRNGRNREIYNQPALEMAARYSLKTTGGSDAHAVDEIGTCVTVFESNIATDADLLNELKAGRFTSARFRARERWSWKEDTRTIERRWV